MNDYCSVMNNARDWVSYAGNPWVIKWRDNRLFLLLFSWSRNVSQFFFVCKWSIKYFIATKLDHFALYTNPILQQQIWKLDMFRFLIWASDLCFSPLILTAIEIFGRWRGHICPNSALDLYLSIWLLAVPWIGYIFCFQISEDFYSSLVFLNVCASSKRSRLQYLHEQMKPC